jgi:hypothetical protein
MNVAMLKGSDVQKTFGPTIAELIKRGVGDRAVLWDTKQLGRPKTMELLAENFYKWKAEGTQSTNECAYTLLIAPR